MASERPPRDVAAEARDEDRDPAGNLRPGYAEAFAALDGTDLEALCRAVAEHLRRAGVSFGGESFVVDPIPRLIPGDEWDPLAAGLAQRGRALNHFLRDAYSERRIVSAGVIPADVIDDAEGFEPDLVGCLPSTGAPAAIIGFDLVRDPSGEFLVLEDNLRTPSGYSYLLAARRALSDLLPGGIPRPRPVEPLTFELIDRALRAAKPPNAGEDPCMVVLTDGEDNVAIYEHTLAASALGLPLVTLADLERDGGGLRVRLGDGASRRVDVVYRRTDEDRIRDEHGAMTDVADLIVPAWLRGEVGLVNAFGNGVADDKCAHGHAEDFIRFYLNEEPLVRSVPSRTLRTPEEVLETVPRLADLVVKPRHGHGGEGVVIGSEAAPEELERAAVELTNRPEQHVVQPIVAISRHPTVIDGRLQPRHVDLRPFAFCTGDDVELIPGGLTRVAFAAGALVVNSSQSGGGKDTWVVD
jgi:uncharacterized circularly permuted ATP-grasp superfamily protein